MAPGRSSDIRRELRKVIPEALVNKLARETGAVQRHRQVKIYDLVWVLVLGFATAGSACWRGSGAGTSG